MDRRWIYNSLPFSAPYLDGAEQPWNLSEADLVQMRKSQGLKET
jgi:hypothetical protein